MTSMPSAAPAASRTGAATAAATLCGRPVAADRALVMGHGSIVFDGTPAELRADAGTLPPFELGEPMDGAAVGVSGASSPPERANTSPPTWG